MVDETTTTNTTVIDPPSIISVNELQDELDALNANITKVGSRIRELKKSTTTTTTGGDTSTMDELTTAIQSLQALKLEAVKKTEYIAQVVASSAATGTSSSSSIVVFQRKVFDDLMIRKMYIIPSFEIHGGVKGLFDLGPPACSLKAAMIDTWRKHFVLNESMLEMECTCLTPAVVLATSGHVERFTDLMVKDTVTGECFRADKLLEDVIDQFLEKNLNILTEEKENHLRVQRQADAYSPTELDALLLQYDCKTASGQPFSSSFPFNLMFRTSIGPEGTAVGYLRPETAQGLFVNFRRLLDLNSGKMPFAAAQIGLGFRNEIAPRSGLLRVREFCMGEIEHFVNPNDKRHANFHTIRDTVLVLFGRDDQLGTGKTQKIAVGVAVETGLINNETLAYFMARTQLYMEKIGMDVQRLRFRQHLTTEMAHYAADCWDLEIQSSFGWVECVGHADRACYDLQVHSTATKTPMVATEKVDPPQEIEYAKLKLDRKELGKIFMNEQRVVATALETLAEDWLSFAPIATALETDGKTIVDGYEVTKAMVSWTKTKKIIHERKFTPSVIEPSFGMGRILYSLLEHSFYQRDGDEQRCVMRFKPQVAPEKCAVFPISSNKECNIVVDMIAADLLDNDLATRVDKSTASLGRRYARADELGVPFAVTVDFQSVLDNTVTVRERDSTKQIRLHKDDVTAVISKIVRGKITWLDLTKKYPMVQVDDGEGNTASTTAASNGEVINNDEKSNTIIETTVRGSFRRPVQEE